MAANIDLKEYKTKIAYTVDELIPCEWNNFAVYAEVSEENNFVTFYVEHEEGAIYRWSELPEEYFGMDMNRFGELLNELEKINYEFWNACKDDEELRWNSYSFKLNSEWECTMEYETEIDETISQYEREIRWAYDEFGVIPDFQNERNILKNYLKSKGEELPKELMDEPLKYEQEIIIEDTPEKFVHMADELVAYLKGHLDRLTELEKEIDIRSNRLTDNKYKLGYESHIQGPGEKELDKEFRKRYGEIVKELCTEELLDYGYAGSRSNPPKYEYLNEDRQIVFTMKSAKRAVIETKYDEGTTMKHKFVLKLTDEGWRLSEVKYGFGSGSTWYKDGI